MTDYNTTLSKHSKRATMALSHVYFSMSSDGLICMYKATPFTSLTLVKTVLFILI